MRIRSTGLGRRTELLANFDNISCVEGHLILSIRTVAPVRWHVRVALTPSDLREMAKLVLKGSNIAYVLSGIGRREEPEPPSDY